MTFLSFVASSKCELLEKTITDDSMLKTLIWAITGISEERYDFLKNEIRRLEQEKGRLESRHQRFKAGLEKEMQALEKAKAEIQQCRESFQEEALMLVNENPRPGFVAAEARLVGPNRYGQPIYEMRVEGLSVPIRTKILDN